jgi:hypothetical protein
VDLNALKKDLAQLWGEAAHREAAGESIRLPQKLWSVAADVQHSRRVGNPHLDTLARALDGIDVGKIAKADAYDLAGLSAAQRYQGNLEAVTEAMAALGWTTRTAHIDGKDHRAFVKGRSTVGQKVPTVRIRWSDDERRYVAFVDVTPGSQFLTAARDAATRPRMPVGEPAPGADQEPAGEKPDADAVDTRLH